MKKARSIMIIFPILTIVLGIVTIYHGFTVLSNWDDIMTPNISALMILMMASVCFSTITVYLQWMQNNK